METQLLAAGLGVFIGLVMALTGAGGGILSVPLLVFGLHLGVAQAAPISMMAVALSAGLGAALALRARILRYRAAAVMGLAGIVLSPLGVWLAQRTPNRPLTIAFSLVLLYVGSRSLLQLLRLRAAHARVDAARVPTSSAGTDDGQADMPPSRLPPCLLDPGEGRLRWTMPCARALVATGMVAGFTSGLLGVGGGFIIVPSLQRVSDLEMRAVVATSLGVLTLVSLAGLLASVLFADVQWAIALPFCLGAIAGMLVGRRLADRLGGPRLQLGFALLAIGVGLGMGGKAAQAREGWPDRPIRLVVPYAAGGVGDISFRVISTDVEARLGQRFLLDNRPGASGNIGAAEVLRAAPDGYTLLLGAINNFATNQFLYKGMSFDPVTAFDPVAVLSLAPNVVAVTPELPATTLAELAALARAQPGGLNYGTPGVGTAPHLAGELFASLAGISLNHVPYNGTPPVLVALRQGSVQVSFYTLSPIGPLIQASRLRPLAVAAPSRLPGLPGVPSAREAGFPDLLSASWQAIVAPRGTETAILDRLNEVIRAALAQPEAQRRYGELGMVAGDLNRAEVAAFIRREAQRWKKVIETARIEPH
jgi:tripartite-type tricarboxylate transporter receptor subunit TctC/uncharacterized membrane protein YfcA